MIRVRYLFIAISMIFGLYYKCIIRGNNKLTIHYYLGLWVPKSTEKIKFIQYPMFPRFVDDDAVTSCEMNRIEFVNMLYSQVSGVKVMRDTVVNGNISTFVWKYWAIPDNTIAEFPLSLRCNSVTGDVLMIDAKLKDSSTVEVRIGTDWD